MVGEGARCNFEDLRWPVGCSNWKIFSGDSNSSNSKGAYTSHLVGLAKNEARFNSWHNFRPGLPPAEYNYHGRVYNPSII